MPGSASSTEEHRLIGPAAARAVGEVVGPEQLLYGSDRPVVEPAELGMPAELLWEAIIAGTRRALGRIRRWSHDALARARRCALQLQPGRPEAGRGAARRGGSGRSTAGRRAAAGPSVAGVPRPRGRDLSAAELREFVGEFADRPELSIDRVKHDRSQRVYEELLSDEHLTAW